jgi:spore coat polysaccharide biosynthesis protein SpsF
VILAILQARVSSTRLPGKVLKDLHGEPMILRQIERLRRSSKMDEFVVATSTESSDDSLAAALEAAGVAVRRGPLDDVAARFAMVIDEFHPDVVVRLTADCPLTDAEVIDRIIESHLASGADYSSNTLEPTFPHGLDAEVFSPQAFARLRATEMSPKEIEHVTYGLYSRTGEFTLNSVTQPVNVRHLRWTVDNPEDLDFVREVYDRLYDANPAFTQADVLELLEREPELVFTEELDARKAR